MSDDIEEMTKTILQTKIVSALKGTPEAINDLIEAALMKQVDSLTGRVDGYYGSKVPYLEYLAGQTIRDAAAVAVREVIAEMRPQIKDIIKEHMSKETVVDAFVKSFMLSTEEDWRISVTLEKDK